jgi:hypothetical protein
VVLLAAQVAVVVELILLLILAQQDPVHLGKAIPAGLADMAHIMAVVVVVAQEQQAPAHMELSMEVQVVPDSTGNLWALSMPEAVVEVAMEVEVPQHKHLEDQEAAVLVALDLISWPRLELPIPAVVVEVADMETTAPQELGQPEEQEVQVL